MQKKTIIIAMLLLFLLVESAIAIPKTKEQKPKPPKIPKIPKMETSTFSSTATLDAGNIYLGRQEIIDTGILYIQGAISTGIISNGESPIAGFKIQTTLSGKLDLNTFQGNYKGEWILNSQTGNFEGTITGKVVVTKISGKFTGQGTGEFENQKIKGTFEGQVNNYKIEIVITATITTKNV
jgi:hypothetical protein